MFLRLIGDVHGKYKQYEKIITGSLHPTVQLGDMGVGFRHLGGARDGEFMRNPAHYKMVRAPSHRFIRGNHDNPSVCERHSQWIPDGHVELFPLGPVMYVGGAVSIDRAFRTPGYSYWEDEELSYEALDKLVEKYRLIRPYAMLTHEAPERIAQIIAGKMGIDIKLGHPSRTRQAFERMLQLHEPKFWFFGHWHYPLDITLFGSRFICLDELQVADLRVAPEERGVLRA